MNLAKVAWQTMHRRRGRQFLAIAASAATHFEKSRFLGNDASCDGFAIGNPTGCFAAANWRG